MDALAALRQYNRWRRGLDAWHDDAGPNPTELGQQIDAACEELEVLRRFHEFFSDNREDLSRHFGMPAVDLYNAALAIRRKMGKP